jgi:dUTP pyrophosphatase
MTELKVKRVGYADKALREAFPNSEASVQIPKYQTAGAACFDIQTLGWGNIAPGTQKTFDTGLQYEIPEGHVMLVFSRSGHGAKSGVRLANGTGVIDSDYRGNLFVALRNDGDTDFHISSGDRIAQAMIVPLPLVTLVEVAELSETARGEGGMGSTGTK